MPLQLPDGRTYFAPEPAEETPVNTTEALDDARAALEDGTAELAAPEPLPCVTAFIVYMLPDGRWQVADDLDVPLVPDRKPHGDDFTAGCATTMRDVQTQETISTFGNTLGPSLVQAVVQNTLNNLPQAMLNFGQAVRQQGEAAQVAAKLEADRNRRVARR